MNIKKIITLPIVIISLASVSSIYVNMSNNKVKASTSWHKGTPKSIRGFYGTHVYGADLVSWIKIKSNKISSWESGMPVIYSKGIVKYKTTGKDKYTFKFNAPANGMFNGEKNMKLTVVRKGKALEVNNYKAHLYYKNYIGKQKG